MKRILQCTLLAAGIAGATFAIAQAADSASAAFRDAQGKQIGKAVLSQTPNGVLIELDVSGLPAGEHALHVHEKGQCDSAGGFKSAGAHFSPGGERHGVQSKDGPHAGDLPNQFVDKDGVLRAHVVSEKVSLSGGSANLLDEDGSALVIHAKPDDYKSQPSGDAGDRIACAEIGKR